MRNQQKPLLTRLEHTFNVMKAAHASPGCLMAIWETDLATMKETLERLRHCEAQDGETNESR